MPDALTLIRHSIRHRLAGLAGSTSRSSGERVDSLQRALDAPLHVGRHCDAGVTAMERIVRGPRQPVPV